MLDSLGYNASHQAKITEPITKYITQMLDYCATHPNANLHYKESDMVIRLHSDGYYISESQALSCSGGGGGGYF